MLCSDFVKFDRREIGKVVRYLPDKKTNFAWLSSSRYCAECAQICHGQPQTCTPDFMQIGSLSVRRSYIRTREHRQRALESESNIRLKLSFEPNN